MALKLRSSTDSASFHASFSLREDMSTEKALPHTDPLLSDGTGGIYELRVERREIGEGSVAENESQQVVMCDCMS